MGMFGSSSDSGDKANQLVEQQIAANAAELEAKRQSLYAERLDIIKGTGGQSFVPDRTVGVSQKGGGKPRGISPLF